MVDVDVLVGFFLGGLHVLSHIVLEHWIPKQILTDLILVWVLAPKLRFQFLKLKRRFLRLKSKVVCQIILPSAIVPDILLELNLGPGPRVHADNGKGPDARSPCNNLAPQAAIDVDREKLGDQFQLGACMQNSMAHFDPSVSQ